jgi:hypothetical protein
VFSRFTLAALVVVLANACSPELPPTDHPLPDAQKAVALILDVYGEGLAPPTVYGVPSDCTLARTGGFGFTRPDNGQCVGGLHCAGVGIWLVTSPEIDNYRYGTFLPHEIRHMWLGVVQGDADLHHHDPSFAEGGAVFAATAGLLMNPEIDRIIR